MTRKAEGPALLRSGPHMEQLEMEMRMWVANSFKLLFHWTFLQENSCIGAIITFFSYILIFLTFPLSIWGCVKVTFSQSYGFLWCHSGCPRIWKSSHLLTWSSSFRRSKRSRPFLHCSLHWQLQVIAFPRRFVFLSYI